MNILNKELLLSCLLHQGIQIILDKNHNFFFILTEIQLYFAFMIILQIMQFDHKNNHLDFLLQQNSF